MKKILLSVTSGLIAFLLATNPSSGASGALAVGWNGCTDTDLQFSQFLKGNFTINVRYLQQYPNAYYGPMIAENGTGNFIIAQGDYFGNGEGSKLYFQIGSTAVFAKTNGTEKKWNDLTIVGEKNNSIINCKVFLNGKPLTALAVSANDPNLPSGTVRFGKRTDNKLINNKGTGQFYGLLDDIGFYNKAYTIDEIQTFFNKSLHLTGKEPNVVAAYTFDLSVKLPGFNHLTGYKGFLKIIEVTENRAAGADLAAIPLPDYHKEMVLPFFPGEEWYVIQGQDDAANSHKGYAAFCWDFDKVEMTNGKIDQSKTKGRPFYASAPGTVIRVDQSNTTPTNIVNMVEVQQADQEVTSYLHLLPNSATVKKGDKVKKYTELGLTGDVGAGAGAYHVHLAVANESDHATVAFVTFPVAFSNYEKKDASGKWVKVAKGIPQAGEIIRNPPFKPGQINLPVTKPATNQTPVEKLNLKNIEKPVITPSH